MCLPSTTSADVFANPDSFLSSQTARGAGKVAIHAAIHAADRVATTAANEADRNHDFPESALCAAPDAEILSTVVEVATDRGSRASGIVINFNRVLTAAHAIQGSGHFFVRIGQVFRSADLVKVDHRRDLAVLAVDTGSLKPVRILASLPAQSDTVWAAGFPRAQSLTLSEGFVKGAKDDILHTSATIDTGQSGGALLSCAQGDWLLAGMLRGFGVYRKDAHYVKVENYSIVVTGTAISEFLSPRQ